MPLGTSIFLIAVGAILRYAVTASVSGISIHTVGLILMIVGAVGLVISSAWSSETPTTSPTSTVAARPEPIFIDGLFNPRIRGEALLSHRLEQR